MVELEFSVAMPALTTATSPLPGGPPGVQLLPMVQSPVTPFQVSVADITGSQSLLEFSVAHDAHPGAGFLSPEQVMGGHQDCDSFGAHGLQQCGKFIRGFGVQP